MYQIVECGVLNGFSEVSLVSASATAPWMEYGVDKWDVNARCQLWREIYLKNL